MPVLLPVPLGEGVPVRDAVPVSVDAAVPLGVAELVGVPVPVPVDAAVPESESVMDDVLEGGGVVELVAVPVWLGDGGCGTSIAPRKSTLAGACASARATSVSVRYAMR